MYFSANNLTGGYGEVNVIENCNFNVNRGEIVSILGPNGAGKSTLVKLLAAEANASVELQAGQRVESDHLNIGYFAQHQLESLDINASALLHIQRLSPAASEQSIRNFLGSFNFHGDKALDPITPFSGGEKARLALAIIVWQKPNLLILDEPTNHLDLEMRHALTLALQMYKGALLVISHDRHLLKNTVDQFYLVAQNKVCVFDGDLLAYQQWLRTALQEQDKNEPSNTPCKLHKVDKKQQRQQEANKRERLKPLTNSLKKIEKEMDQLQSKLTLMDERLSDDTLYKESHKDELQTLLQEQGKLRSRVEVLEEEWLATHEEIENCDN